jgi:hypothetical protein
MSHRYLAIFQCCTWAPEYINKYGSNSMGSILGIYLGPGSQVRVQVPKYGSHRQEVDSISVGHKITLYSQGEKSGKYFTN